jgi:hypothetical protein
MKGTVRAVALYNAMRCHSLQYRPEVSRSESADDAVKVMQVERRTVDV